ncbi:hypothetical protein D3C80_1599170 [compost metagenome]
MVEVAVGDVSRKFCLNIDKVFGGCNRNQALEGATGILSFSVNSLPLISMTMDEAVRVVLKIRRQEQVVIVLGHPRYCRGQRSIHALESRRSLVSLTRAGSGFSRSLTGSLGHLRSGHRRLFGG